MLNPMSKTKLGLLATTAPLSLLFASPVLAQDRVPATTATTAAPDPEEEQANTTGDDIVVTGSLLRRTDAETPSPVTVVDAELLERRGISTIQDAIQNLASNNGPALTNSFTANGAFAAGASAVSLRGLSTNSTLVLFDGLRAAYYPLADDGSRNFVDLNTIPDDIVERIEVLRDGASSSYGADAIAGVVNIITKKEFKGVGGRAEAGISDRGDAAQYRLSLTAGLGDLDDNGYNAYLSGFYFKSEALFNRDRPYPYNTDDARGLVSPDGTNSGPDGRLNALPASGLPTGVNTGANFVVRPYDATNTTAQGPFQNLSACTNGTTLTLTDRQRRTTLADGTPGPITFPTELCQVDSTNQYGVITPNIERFGGSFRVTASFGNDSEAYLMANFLQSSSQYTGAPATVFNNAPTGIFFPRFSTASNLSPPNAPGSLILNLPVFVCPDRTDCANDPARTLNPNNPFAAQGQVARITGRDLTRVVNNETRNRSYRAALGVRGQIMDKFDYEIGATAMHSDLRRTQEGYVFIQRLLDVIADGTYNFRNPGATPQSVQDYLTPTQRIDSTSDQYQLQATVGAELFQLPGGPAQLGVGASIRYEAVDAPSGNTDANGPTQRYFTLNAFGTKGSRRIYSGFAELNLPVFDQLEINASGRYDRYSSGQDAFSPKIGAKVQPIRQVAIRGTYSKGFRIPSFGEANALPTTGFVTNQAALFTDAYLAQYGCTRATFAACPAYIRQGSYGLTTLASPNLDPEKSRSFTAGIIVEPIRNVSLTVDYFNIRKTGAITAPDSGSALQAYYAGTPIDPVFNVIPDAPSTDPQFAAARPRVAFVESQLVNSDTIKAQGIDIAASAAFDVTSNIRFNAALEASYIIKLSTTVDGVEQRYDGTLGNFNLTAGSGTPSWHGSLQGGVEFDDTFILTATGNYFDGYNLSAEDQGTERGDGTLNPGYSPTGDDIPSYITLDLNASFKINDRFTFYTTVVNVLDDLPPIDVVTYGANFYNPVQGGLGILGRYIKAGVKVGF